MGIYSYKEYLLGYSIGGDKLADMQIPCRIISARDDPIIRADDLQELAQREAERLEAQYGDELLAQLVANKGLVAD